MNTKSSHQPGSLWAKPLRISLAIFLSAVLFIITWFTLPAPWHLIAGVAGSMMLTGFWFNAFQQRFEPIQTGTPFYRTQPGSTLTGLQHLPRAVKESIAQNPPLWLQKPLQDPEILKAWLNGRSLPPSINPHLPLSQTPAGGSFKRFGFATLLLASLVGLVIWQQRRP